MNINKLKSYLIFNICAIIILLSLGTWQLERLQWKNRYISQIETKISMPAIEINENNSIYLDTYKNRKITIKGSYLYDKKITLHSKVYNKLVGKHLLVPLKTDYGYLLVNRGFITDAGLKNLNEDTEVLNITGMINFSSKKPYFIPNNNLQNNDWYYVNIKEIGEYLSLNLLNYYLIEENNLAEPFPIGSQYNIDIPNDHLQYAVTWFSLALALSVFMHLVWRKYE